MVNFYPIYADRNEAILRAYIFDELTGKQIAARYGITYQRVFQICNGLDPTLMKLHRRRHKARANLRRFVRSGSVKITRQCKVCGEEFDGWERMKYCTPMHHKIWLLLRYQIDDKHHETQKKAAARWNLNNGKYVAYSTNVLNDTVGEGHRTGARYLTHGSLAMHWALRAYALDWPIFNDFHPKVQDQIRQYAKHT